MTAIDRSMRNRRYTGMKIMRLATAMSLGLAIQCAWNVTTWAGPPAPGAACQSCQSAPCGCAGHASDCCCDGLCRQAPPNPLAPGRPSPPPCSADGYCYPNYETWGHYRTRWRRWPIEISAAPAAARPGAKPAELGPDVPKYEALPPEEEDRRAPPPSVTRGKPVEFGPRQAGPQEGTGEEAPATAPRSSLPGLPTPPQEGTGTIPSPESIFGLPPEETSPAGPPTPGTPTDQTPRTAPLAPPAGSGLPPTSAPVGEPVGDEDQPPALPFAAPKLNGQPGVPSTTMKPAAAAREADDSASPDDPPPSLPLELAAVLR